MKKGIVLEGGSLRCMFTAGVLDMMMKNNITFDYINGVSAGSMCALNFLSGQIGRTREVNLNFCDDERFMSMKNFVDSGSVFNFDFMFGELSREIMPYHFDQFEQNPTEFEAVATNCESGQAEYLKKGEVPNMFAAVQASCSLPLMANVVEIKGKPYLDGGLACPVAYERALEMGCEKLVVVLTREADFCKTAVGRLINQALEHKYKEYPHLLETIERRPQVYNDQYKKLQKLYDEGKILIIRPDGPVNVSPTETDRKKLKALYLRGVYQMQKQMEELEAFLKED